MWFSKIIEKIKGIQEKHGRDLIMALMSGGVAAGLSVWWGVHQWTTTNYNQQLTSYKETIIENLLFDGNGKGTSQLLYDEEKLKALKALTSDALIKLDKKHQRELLKFLQNLELLGRDRPKKTPGKNNPQVICIKKLKGEVPDDKTAGELCNKYPSLLAENLLRKINLEKAALNNADLSRSYLSGANFYQSSLQGANLQEAILFKKIEGWERFFKPHRWFAPYQPTNLEGANLQGANLQRANLREANLGNGWERFFKPHRWFDPYKPTNLEKADLRKANLRGADLKNIELKNTNLVDAIYDKDTKFTGVDLEKQGAYLIAPGEELIDADLRYADLSYANLTGANLTGADLTGADLTKAKVSDEVLKKAKLCKTIWIDGSIQKPDCIDRERGTPDLLPGASTTKTDEPGESTATPNSITLLPNRF